MPGCYYIYDHTRYIYSYKATCYDTRYKPSGAGRELYDARIVVVHKHKVIAYIANISLFIGGCLAGMYGWVSQCFSVFQRRSIYRQFSASRSSIVSIPPTTTPVCLMTDDCMWLRSYCLLFFLHFQFITRY